MSFHKLSALVVVLAGLVYYFCILESVEITVQTKFGTLKGFQAKSRDGKVYSAYRGIPFAKPPIGELRFQAPVEFGNWQGVKDAKSLPPLCFQADSIWNAILGQEDCLYLNVYTPAISATTDRKNLLPVMVFFHGGYFMYGGSNVYNPSYFMDQDVVLVTVQYRLGALGFLSTGDDVVSGNMGLKDQSMALKWVASTIKDFGGDPNLITIFGESAGAASTHFHMFSPLSRGLFQRAISQSGNSLCSFTNPNKDTKAQAIKLGNSLNCSTQSSESLVRCLKSKSAREITETHMASIAIFLDPQEIYGPTIEKGGESGKTFLTRHPRDVYKEGDVAKVPWLAGVNSEEGSWRSLPIVVNDGAAGHLYSNWNTIAPKILMYNDDPVASEKIKKFYFGENPKPFSSKDLTGLTNMYSDRYFMACLSEAARFHVKHAPTYLYYFSRKNPEASLGLFAAAKKNKYPLIIEYGLAKLKVFLYRRILGWEVPDYGTCHVDELNYMFPIFPLTWISESSPHYEFSKSFVNLWVSFAKNGYPGKYEGVTWTKAESNKEPRYLHIGDQPPKMIVEPFTARSKFWESLQLTPK